MALVLISPRRRLWTRILSHPGEGGEIAISPYSEVGKTAAFYIMFKMFDIITVYARSHYAQFYDVQ